MRFRKRAGQRKKTTLSVKASASGSTQKHQKKQKKQQGVSLDGGEQDLRWPVLNPLTLLKKGLEGMQAVGSQFLASLTFYTSLPFFNSWSLDFHRIARFAPLVGLLLGFLLGAIEFCLAQLQIPLSSRSAIVVVTWVALTGGLHLDGAMDTADGLAVMEPKRRLSVMADSVTGAFGVMAAIAILLLKFSALMSLPLNPPMRTAALMAAAGWGRWGQVLAIARYPYLKLQGKGAFHKQQFKRRDLWPGLVLLLGLSLLYWALFPFRGLTALGMVLGGFAVAFSTGSWLNRRLGGHTGDTYGAVVEWTEAILLCLLTALHP